jgi:hypothetical protein
MTTKSANQSSPSKSTYLVEVYRKELNMWVHQDNKSFKTPEEAEEFAWLSFPGEQTRILAVQVVSRVVKITGLVDGTNAKPRHRVEIEVGAVKVSLSLKEAAGLLKQLNDTIHDLTQVG